MHISEMGSAKNYLLLGAFAAFAGALFVLNPSGGFVGFLSGKTDENGNFGALISENENLKTQIAILRDAKSQLPNSLRGKTEAFVYSKYPFNLKSELMINVGRSGGVEEGSAVIFRGDLIGKIIKIFDAASLAVTVFDSRFQVAVRVGEKATEALFVGGNRPKLTLIPKSAKLAVGDRIYSAGQGFSYGLPMGEVADVSISPDQSFMEAGVRFQYDLNAARVVSIEKNGQ